MASGNTNEQRLDSPKEHESPGVVEVHEPAEVSGWLEHTWVLLQTVEAMCDSFDTTVKEGVVAQAAAAEEALALCSKVEEGMTHCLAIPQLSPFINTEGVATLIQRHRGELAPSGSHDGIPTPRVHFKDAGAATTAANAKQGTSPTSPTQPHQSHSKDKETVEGLKREWCSRILHHLDRLTSVFNTVDGDDTTTTSMEALCPAGKMHLSLQMSVQQRIAQLTSKASTCLDEGAHHNGSSKAAMASSSCGWQLLPGDAELQWPEWMHHCRTTPCLCVQSDALEYHQKVLVEHCCSVLQALCDLCDELVVLAATAVARRQRQQDAFRRRAEELFRLSEWYDNCMQSHAAWRQELESRQQYQKELEGKLDSLREFMQQEGQRRHQFVVTSGQWLPLEGYPALLDPPSPVEVGLVVPPSGSSTDLLDSTAATDAQQQPQSSTTPPAPPAPSGEPTALDIGFIAREDATSSVSEVSTPPASTSTLPPS